MSEYFSAILEFANDCQEEASVVHPKHYSERFFRFLCDLIPESDSLRKEIEAEKSSDEDEDLPEAGSAKTVMKI